jgi:hypothetical protein
VLREVFDIAFGMLDFHLAALRSHFDPLEWAGELTAGRAMSLDEAIDYARSWVQPPHRAERSEIDRERTI